tara:strand:+ start:1352 stop:1882 length:531 start_codon:yes stop_codon:yes gene_type:complete
VDRWGKPTKNTVIIQKAFLVPLIFFVASSLYAQTALDLIPDELVNANGEVHEAKLDGKFVGIYFSASWCPPCQFFSPELVKFRNENKEDFEVIYVSSDVSVKEQYKYMKKMKAEFGAVPYKGETSRKLAQAFHVRYLPTLVIVSPEGKVLTMDGRGDINRLKNSALTNWKSNLNNP